MASTDDLNAIHDAINSCNICAGAAEEYEKPPPLDRGTSRSVVIVGQGPGGNEVKKARAFAGPAGKRLDEWLVGCGASPDKPRADVYLTSVVKCRGSNSSLPAMTRNCFPLLRRQLQVLRPELLITLGDHAFTHIRMDLALDFLPTDFAKARCSHFRTREYLLLTELGYHFTVLVWPHPSPLDRWLNLPENTKLLAQSFSVVKSHLERTL